MIMSWSSATVRIVLTPVVISFAVRLILQSFFPPSSVDRWEFTSPYDSYSNAVEAVFFRKHGKSIYATSAFQQNPLLPPLLSLLPSSLHGLLYMFLDVSSALLLFGVSGYDPVVLNMLLFSPVSIGSFLSRTTTLWSNWFLSLSLFLLKTNSNYSLLKSIVILISLSLFCLFSPLYMFVVVPLALLSSRQAKLPRWSLLFLCLMPSFLSCILTPQGAATLQVQELPDVAPSVSMLWYIRTVASSGILLDCAIYLPIFLHIVLSLVVTIPEKLRFSANPFFMAYVMFSITTLFNPYATVVHLQMVYTLFILLGDKRKPIRFHNEFRLISVMTIILFSVFSYYWADANAIDSNYVFEMSVVLSFFQSYLLTESMEVMLQAEEESQMVDKKRD